ncbi:MAG TPA: hypothetical protein VJY62_07295 [Bacteroidia bacterium]|nr:hypothetical protein [Bacteroidia bacterium]
MEKPVTLEDAFKTVLYERGLLIKIGYTKDTISNLKRNLEAGKVTIDRMREVVKDSKLYKLHQPELYMKK